MMIRSVPAPDEVHELVQRFADNRDEYESDAYNETQLRREFLDPFLTALGWDVDNSAGYAEAYKDVVHEDAVHIDGSPKAPDYSCRVGGTRKFFVEAKKPSVNVVDDRGPAYQLRRYAWSADLPLSVLSNFKTFAAYDGRVPPSPTDRASVARELLVGFEEYDERWDEIASVFSRDAVLRGAFDRFATGARRRRGTAQVDQYFLREIEDWREGLAANLVARNRGLSQQDLNYAVQTTLDRVIFLRICEDRGLEAYGTLRDLLPRRGVYARLLHQFELADARYNSGLFHFQTEAGRGAPDQLTPGLRVDDAVLRDIIGRLYYPESPYEFSVFSPEILGQVYEQFLGKIIRLLPRRQISVEEKPEIRRAGGVYYTPAYIVRFIVERAVQPALEGLTPENFIRGGQRRRRLRIVDPACGSGSFLIVAYQHLLDWYLSWYSANEPARWARGRNPRIFRGPRDQWLLTIAERKRILLDHIYGVDIDSQAVEVTKLSLLLKVLEGEATQALQLVLRVLDARALPDLDSNIRCGNSLVGVDVLSQLPDLDENEVYRINPFHWQTEFPDAFASGGFDAVIGNPPYVYRNATENSLRPYYAATYQSAQGNYDLYKFFIERGIKIAKSNHGRLGFIVSASFLIQPTFSRLRAFILGNSQIESLAPLGPGAFSAATIDSTILVARTCRPDLDADIEVRAPNRPTRLIETTPYPIPQGRFARNPDQVFDYRLTERGARIVARLSERFPVIETGFEFGVGINTGYIRDLLTSDRQVDARYHPMVPGTGISRYGPVDTDGFIMYDPDFVQAQGERGRSLPQERLLSEPKLLVVRTRNLGLKQRIVATLDLSGAYNLNRLSNIIARQGRSLAGLLALLSSRLFRWLFSTRYYDYEIKPVYLRNSPLLNTEDAELIRAAEQILRLTAQAVATQTSGERERIERRIQAAKQRADDAVWRLAGLGAADRRHIEAQLQEFDVRAQAAPSEDFALTLAAEQQRRDRAA